MIDLRNAPLSVRQQLGNNDIQGTNDILETFDNYDRLTLNTRSKYHQFIDFKDRVVKRYTKSTIVTVSFFRSHPSNRTQRVGAFLQTDMPDSLIEELYVDRSQESNGALILRPVFNDINIWRYESDVIELYNFDDIELFERWNAKAFELNLLVEYDDNIEYAYNVFTGLLEEKGKGIRTERKPATLKG